MEKFKAIKTIIDEWDPLGLLAMGCPDDEYNLEIVDVVRLLAQVKSADELALGIRQVFIEWFGEYLPLEKCLSPALKIWNMGQIKSS